MSPTEPNRDVVGARVLIVVPAFNEAATVAEVVRSLHDGGHSVLVVDDGSHDDTAAHARRAGAAVARLATNLGVGAALRCGFRYAVEHGFDAVVQCDADGQHPTDQIRHLLDADPRLCLVIGSRFGGDGPSMHLSMPKRAGMALLRRRLPRGARTRIADPTSGFRLFREPLLGEFAREFPAAYLGDTFEALVHAVDLVGPERIGEVSVHMHERQGGRASATGFRAVAFLTRTVFATSGLVRRRRAPLNGPRA